MSGLLLKDVLNMKRQGRIFLVIIAAWLVLGLIEKSMAGIMNMLPLLALWMVINAMAYDEAAHWERYALTMPVSRSDMVLCKYLLSVLSVLATMALSVVLSLISGASLGGALLASGGISCFALCYMALMLPVMFWLGVQKARVVIILIALVPVALGSLVESGSLTTLLAMPELTWLLPLATLALLALSALVSLRIYARKAF